MHAKSVTRTSRKIRAPTAEFLTSRPRLGKLLYPDPKLAPLLVELRTASASSHEPYRICETNSFCGGGKPGVSDTFGSALWVLDYMFALAHADAAGVNMETGVNQLGFISSYSPIGEDEQGTYLAKPEYYGMLAFAHASQGQRVALDYDTADVNLKAYAVLSRRGRISVTLVNKDASRDADVSVIVKGDFARVNALRLTGPSLASPDGVRLGGSAVAANGSWQPTLEESLRTKGGKCEIHVPAASAAIMTWEA